MTDQLTRALPDAIAVRSESERLIDIRLVPWGVIAQTTEGPESFARGAFDGVDPTRVTIESQRHGGTLVGRGMALEQRDDAAYLTARIAPTPAGDEMLTLAAERVLPDASVSFFPVRQRRRNGATERTAVDLRRVAIVERGTYPGAGVVAIRSETEPPAPPDPAPEPTPAPDPAPFQREVMAELGALRVMVAGGARGDDPYLILRSEPDFGHACQRAWRDPDYRDLLTRVMADEITSDNPGLVPPGWLQEIRTILPARKPAVAAFGQAGLPDTGMDFSWPTFAGDIKALIAKQAAQKTALNSAKISFGKDNVAIDSFGFVHDIAYQLVLRSSPSYIASANRVLLAAFAYYEDNALVSAITAHAGKGSVVLASGATADAVKAAFFDASMQVEAATGAPASFALAGSTWFAELGGLAGLTPSPYGTQNVPGTATASTLAVSVSGLPVIHDPFMAPTDLWFSNQETAKWHVDGPRFATAEDVEKLGRNDAIWGMGAAAIYVPAGIVAASAVAGDAASRSRSRQ